MPGTVNVAKVYLHLIRHSPTRHEFLERFFSRRLPADKAFVGPSGLDVNAMRDIFFKAPCDEAFGQSVVQLLRRTSVEAAEMYRTEVLRHVGCASSTTIKPHSTAYRRTFPGVWPSWPEEYFTSLDNKTFGYLKGGPPWERINTFWYGQGGWLKTDQRYLDTREVVLRATFKFETASLNDDLSFMKPSRSRSLSWNPDALETDVVVFTSNALAVLDWTHDGTLRDEHGVRLFGKRLKKVFSSGVVIETRASGYKPNQRLPMIKWSF